MSLTLGAPARGAVRRSGVFVVGLLLVLLGAAAWLLSALLAVPFTYAGLLTWSREFPWARRLLAVFVRWSQVLWKKVEAQPVRWSLSSVVSLGTSTGGYLLLV